MDCDRYSSHYMKTCKRKNQTFILYFPYTIALLFTGYKNSIVIKGIPINKWKKIVELEYHYFSTPNKLLDLDIGHQMLLISQKEWKPDIVHLLMKEHSTTYGLFQGILPKCDKAFGSSCQLAGKTEDRGHVELHQKQNPDCGKPHTKSPGFSIWKSVKERKNEVKSWRLKAP